MKGHVRKRGATWAFVVELERAQDGKRRQKWRSGFPTKKAAQVALTEALGELNQGGDPFPAEITVADYSKRWLDDHQSELRMTTWARYEALLRDNILPVIGARAMHRVGPADVKAVLAEMRRPLHGRTCDRPLSPRTITQARAVLGSVFQSALVDAVVRTNPVRAVKRPHLERADLAVPNAVDVRRLLQVAEGDRWELPIVLAVSTGARRSEILAIRWADVDLDSGRVRLWGAVHKEGDGYKIGTQKTTSARRNISLPTFAVSVLRRHKSEQNARRLRLGSVWQDQDLVCDGGDGRVIPPDSFTQAFKRLAVAAGLDPRTRLHDLRHAYATMLLEAGTHYAVASAALGHSTPSFTMSVYQHVSSELTDQAAVAIEAALG